MAVPALMPATIPENNPTVAVPVAELLHVPPGVALESEVLDPAQTNMVPTIGEGSAAILIVAVV